MVRVGRDPEPALVEALARSHPAASVVTATAVGLVRAVGALAADVVVLLDGALDDPERLVAAVDPLVRALCDPPVPFAEPVSPVRPWPDPFVRRRPAGQVLAARRSELVVALERLDPAVRDEPLALLPALARGLADLRTGWPALVEAVVPVPALSDEPWQPARTAVRPADLTAEPTTDEGLARWSVLTPVPFEGARDGWGDLHYARGLAAALRRHGRAAGVDYRDTVDRAGLAAVDVAVVLRGLERLDPPEHAVAILWVISHPELVADDELAAYDLVVAAGPRWAAQTSARTGIPVLPLLQGTDTDRFGPGKADGPASQALFVGNSRHVRRPVLDDALAAGADVTVYGAGWDEVLPDLAVAGRHLPNAEVPAAYRSARVVLNDHWDDMAAGGFVSNRLFDAAACGARVLSDEVAGVPGGVGALFGGSVRTYARGDVATLAGLLTEEGARHGWPAAAERRRTAARVRRLHGLDERARVLIAAARAVVEARRSSAGAVVP